MPNEAAQHMEAQQVEALGPGGVPTPSAPENTGTPTPQPESEGGLKPLTALLGQEPAGGADGSPAAPTEEPVEAPPAASSPAAEGGPAARINKLTAEKWEEKRAREAAEARARLAEETLAELARANPDLAGQVRAPGTPAASPSASPERRFTQAELQAEAQRIAAEQVFNGKINDTVMAGRQAHADFDASVAELKKITGPVVPPEFLIAALETGQAPELIYSLGKNPGEADRILSLPPIQQAVALARYADGLRSAAQAATEPANVSRAPAPITPKVSGSARRELALDDPNLPLTEFIRRRNEAESAARRRA